MERVQAIYNLNKMKNTSSTIMLRKKELQKIICKCRKPKRAKLKI